MLQLTTGDANKPQVTRLTAVHHTTSPGSTCYRHTTVSLPRVARTENLTRSVLWSVYLPNAMNPEL